MSQHANMELPARRRSSRRRPSVPPRRSNTQSPVRSTGSSNGRVSINNGLVVKSGAMAVSPHRVKSKFASSKDVREGGGDEGGVATSADGAGAGLGALRSCLEMLEAGGFLRVCEGGKTFICDDVMLIDQVCSRCCHML